MGPTRFRGGLEVDGIPIFGGGVPAFLPGPLGRVFHVDYALGYDSSDRGTERLRPVKTLAFCHDNLMTADRDDIAIVYGQVSTASAQRLSDTLVWSKNKCHILGANAFNRFGHRVSLRQLSTATVFTPFVSVTAGDCIFANFHTFYGFADNSAQVNWIDTGNRNKYFGVHLGGMGAQLAADHAGSRNLVLGSGGNGEHLFVNCVIGLDTVDRGAANASLEMLAGTTRNIFENCHFVMRADATSPVFLLIGSGGIDRFVDFRKCMFINSGTFTGGSTITEAFTVHASAGGVVLVQPDTNLVGAGDWENTQSSRVYVAAAQAAATSGRMIAATT